MPSLSMKTTYDQRLATFTSWPHSRPSAEDMAAAGYSYAPSRSDGDLVVCSDCPSILADWKENDVPLEEHEANCPFILNHQQESSSKSSSLIQATDEVTISSPTPTATSTSPASDRKRDAWLVNTSTHLPNLIAKAPLLPAPFEKEKYLQRWNQGDVSFGNRYQVRVDDKEALVRTLVHFSVECVMSCMCG